MNTMTVLKIKAKDTAWMTVESFPGKNKSPIRWYTMAAKRNPIMNCLIKYLIIGFI